MNKILKIFLILIILLPTPLLAETFPEFDINALMNGKRAVVKETMQLTEKESAVFWPLYDEIEKIQVKRFNRYAALIRQYLQESENLSDKSARAMTKELIEIQNDKLKFKQKYAKKLSEKLSDKRVFQYLVLEERVDAGFSALIAEELPPIK